MPSQTTEPPAQSSKPERQNLKFPGFSADCYVPTQQFNQAQTAQRDAATSLQQAREQEAATLHAVGTEEAAVAAVQARQAALAIARRALDDTIVRAWHDGRVVGLTVLSGEMVVPSQALFTLISTEEWFAVANFRETDLHAIAVGDRDRLFDDRSQSADQGRCRRYRLGRAGRGAHQSAAFGALCAAIVELGEGCAALCCARPAAKSARTPHEARCERNRRGQAWRSEIATRALLYVWLFVGIPAGVSIGVNLLLAPSPRLLAEQALARAFAPRHRHAACLRRRRHKARLHRMFARGKWRIAKVAEACPRREKRGSRTH
jgi:hypothetical protein